MTPPRHIWFIHPKFRPLETCKACGVVRRPDGKNGPCPGKVRMQLREIRIGETKTPANSERG